MAPRPLVSAALALVLCAYSAAAQERPFPYVLSSRDVAIVGAGAGLSLLGDRVANGRDPLTRAQVAPLTPDDINAFDRTAARNWSPNWEDRSDQGHGR
jgi:hypothetical protein